MNNQRGISSLVLLVFVVFGIFILWEINEYILKFPREAARIASTQNAGTAPGEPICLTGETDNCNDSNDSFILTE